MSITFPSASSERTHRIRRFLIPRFGVSLFLDAFFSVKLTPSQVAEYLAVLDQEEGGAAGNAGENDTGAATVGHETTAGDDTMVE